MFAGRARSSAPTIAGHRLKLCKRCNFSHQVRLQRGDGGFVKHGGRQLKWALKS